MWYWGGKKKKKEKIKGRKKGRKKLTRILKKEGSEYGNYKYVENLVAGIL